MDLSRNLLQTRVLVEHRSFFKANIQEIICQSKIFIVVQNVEDFTRV